MDKNIFNNLVDELLIPTYKTKFMKNREVEKNDPRGRCAITTLSPRPHLEQCGDCGVTVENRVIHIQKKINYNKSKNPNYWEKTCVNCTKKWPISGPLDK